MENLGVRKGETVPTVEQDKIDGWNDWVGDIESERKLRANSLCMFVLSLVI